MSSRRSKAGSRPSMSHAPTATLSVRHHHIRQAMAERSLDALVLTSLPNITYLTNFRGSSAIAVLTRDRLIFITDSRYTTVLADTQATSRACPGLEVAPVGGSYDATLAGVLTGL